MGCKRVWGNLSLKWSLMPTILICISRSQSWKILMFISYIITCYSQHASYWIYAYLQVVSGIRAGIIKGLAVGEKQKFSILSLETTASDISNLKETLQAFKQLQFSALHLEQIYQVCFLWLLSVILIKNMKMEWFFLNTIFFLFLCHFSYDS